MLNGKGMIVHLIVGLTKKTGKGMIVHLIVGLMKKT